MADHLSEASPTGSGMWERVILRETSLSGLTLRRALSGHGGFYASDDDAQTLSIMHSECQLNEKQHKMQTNKQHMQENNTSSQK